MRLRHIPVLLLLFLCASPVLHAQQSNLKSLQKELDHAFETFAPTGLAVAVVQDDQVIYQNAWGVRAAGTDQQLTTRSLFNIASCSKAFTAAALAKVVEQGQANWDDKLIAHVPEFRLADPWITAQLNLVDILTHRTGLGTFYGDLLWYGTDYTHADIIRRMRELPITNDFRSQFGYQNNMYMLAGEVVSRATGKTWSEFIDQTFFTALDMTESRPSNDDLDPGQEIAWPHIDGQKTELFDFTSDKAAGAIFSNVEELSHWVRMLLNQGKYQGKQILSPATVDFLFTPQTLQNLPANWRKWGIHFRSYALGWGTFDYGGAKVVEHNGGMPGYISKVSLIPEKNIGVIVLNNGMDFFVNDVVRFLVYDHLLQRPDQNWVGNFDLSRQNYLAWKKGQDQQREASRQPGTKPALPLEAYAGTFRDDYYGDARVEHHADGLYLDLLPCRFFQGSMSHWHHDTFKVQFDDPFLTYALVTFEKNSQGQVTGFKIDLPSDDFHFEILHFKTFHEKK